MRCHYEVLGVPRIANDDEIKKSYRKLALRWHPDKNPDNIDEATVEFRCIQTAYDVLSDPQERAWYDKHREAILKGGLGHGDDYEDECLDVYAYFNTSCYSAYDDSEKGFYTVFRQVFEQVAAEDRQYKDESNNTKEASSDDAPGFGNSLSSFDEVVKSFYGYWDSYCTARSYAWTDKYDTRAAPDRFTRRAMEAENEKLRKAARRERNDEVRALVAFVKKRDPRVQAEKRRLQERAEEVKRRAEGMRKEHKRQHLKLAEGYRDAEWASMANLEGHLQQLESTLTQEFRERQCDSDSDDSDVEDDGLFCVVCNKSFKSERSLANHEKSKKHRENLLILREEMLAEEEVAKEEFSATYNTGDACLRGDNTITRDSEMPVTGDGNDAGDNESGNEAIADPDKESVSDTNAYHSSQPSERLSKKQKKKRKQRNKMQQAVAMDRLGSDEEQTADVQPAAAAAGNASPAEVDDTVSAAPEVCRQNGVAPEIKQKRRRRQQNKASASVAVTAPPDGDSDQPVRGADDRINPRNDATLDDVRAGVTLLSIAGDGDDDLSKADDDLLCRICKATFSTRNKLFQHIKAERHAVVHCADESDDGTPVKPAAGKKKGRRK